MEKTKIISLIVIVMLASIGASSICIAEEIDKIDVDISKSIGLVKPKIVMDESMDVTFVVNVTKNETVEKYVLEDELKINLDINDTSGKDQFFLPHGLVGYTVISRKLGDAIGMNIPDTNTKLIDKWMPVKKPINVNLVNSSLGNSKPVDNITIPLKYKINNATYQSGEELTMHIAVMGFFPDDVNGVGSVKIVDYKKVSLNVSYVPLVPVPE